MSERMCSCGRAAAVLGCDLCMYCEEDWQRAQDELEKEEWPMPDEDSYIVPKDAA